MIIYSTPTLGSNTPTTRSHVLIVGTQTADIFFSLSPYLNLSTEVTLIHHGQEALVFLQKNQVDMLIADQFLADMPGFELIQTMRRQGLSKLYTILLVSDEIYSRALSFHSGFAVDMYLNPQKDGVLNASLLQQALNCVMKKHLSEPIYADK